MSSRAVITQRSAARTEAAAASESSAAKDFGLKVEQHLRQGALVSGDQ
jgi:hypothetical protein